MTESPLTGTWRLVSWHNRTADGETVYPLGPDAVGLVTYTGDGHMMVHIARADRSRYATEDMAGGSTEEDVAAMKSMIAYAGRYEFRGDHVLHHVTLSSFPNWVGSSQKRHVRFDGDRLVLSTDPITHQGREITAELVWERLPTA